MPGVVWGDPHLACLFFRVAPTSPSRYVIECTDHGVEAGSAAVAERDALVLPDSRVRVIRIAMARKAHDPGNLRRVVVGVFERPLVAEAAGAFLSCCDRCRCVEIDEKQTASDESHVAGTIASCLRVTATVKLK